MKNRVLFLAFLMVYSAFACLHAQTDSTKQPVVFTGAMGLTNNGFSIIPTFSFNSPASLFFLSFRHRKFSFDPDIRVVPDGKKGSVLLWMRYHAVEGKKFHLRVGFHPAVNWSPVETTNNGRPTEWLQMRRFLAWEVNPSIQVKPNWNIGLYYLQGNGLQNYGPQTTHFVNLNTSISRIRISEQVHLTVTPAVFYLYLDGKEGQYFTATGTLTHKKFPISIQSIINKTIRSNIVGNRDFLWNLSVFYHFKKVLR